MKSNGNLILLAALAVVAFLLTGCGGFSASRSVSPASFFLPGLLRADPCSTNLPVARIQLSPEFASVK